MYDIPKLFLWGGPDNATTTTSVYIYNQAFSGSYLYNRAAAASMVMFVIIAILSVFLFFILRDKDSVLQRKRERTMRKEAKARMREVAL
jgi:multiple sugar transport system permease protein